MLVVLETLMCVSIVQLALGEVSVWFLDMIFKGLQKVLHVLTRVTGYTITILFIGSILVCVCVNMLCGSM